MSLVQRIRKWHVGKLTILWVWMGVFSVWLINMFQSTKIKEATALALLCLAIALLLLMVMSVITWIWLGGKEC